ncbi:uncharacterized protein LOC110114846 isoform X3 [Dendrobium catenatum]|uniref:uncharacterized protein LOC110114846 isoform X3 n=1 Tax=Dendrobium catenatum TaxID=906689 RepID=UPI0009F1B61C|nr:uncharacterized protein LOC110114846 isoform X3 [Dendrobium catenatum]
MSLYAHSNYFDALVDCRKKRMLVRTVLSLFQFSQLCAKLEELADAGEGFLRGFYRELVNSCKLRLEDYLIKAKAVLDELESLKHNAIDIIKHAIDDHSSDRVFNFLDDNITQQSQSVREDVQESLLLDGSMSRSTLMTIIYGMLKLEFSMQEKIIRSLNLKTSSSLFESYCLFWELRPNIDDNVMHQAWKYVSG